MFTVGLLVWIVDPRTLAGAVTEADPLLVLAICGMAFVWLFLGALNVWILLRSLGDISLGTFTEIYLTSWSLGLLIPGQLGDATQILLMRRHGYSASGAAAAYAIDKLLSLCMFLLIGIYGAARYATGSTPTFAASLALTVVPVTAAIVVAAARMSPTSWLPKRIRDFIRSFSGEIGSFGGRFDLIGLNAAISIAKWLIMAAMYRTAFSALGVGVSFEAAATIPVVSSLVAYIPVTIAGLGTTEWTAIGLFNSTGVGALQVTGVYVIMRGMLIAVAAIMLAIRWGLRYARAD